VQSAMADVTLDHRYPTISMQRDQNVEPGTRIALYWDGVRAPNNDGVPGGAGIDYTKPLIVAPMWSKGHRTLFGGGFARGGFTFMGATPDPSMGFAKGPFAMGAFAIGSSTWAWTSPFSWRDGEYALAMRLQDRLGNENATDVATLSIEIAALPRPVPRAWVSAIEGEGFNVQVQWRHSPEFEATE
jgi:hypothetical protein